MIAAVASSGLLRSAWTLSQRTPWAAANSAQIFSVGAREDSDVKFRRRETPLPARLRATASPIPKSQG